MYVCTYVHTYIRMYVCMYVCMYICSIYVYVHATGGKNLKKFKEWLEADSITDTKIVEQTWDLLAYLAYDTLQQVSTWYGP